MTRIEIQTGLTRRNLLLSGAIIFLIKVVVLYGYCQLSISQEPNRQIGRFSFASGDDYSYTGAMENYITQGKYYFINQLGDTVRAGRSPHYSIPYWIARQATGREAAVDFMTIVNIALDSIAIVCMAIMAFVITGYRKLIYLGALIIGAISTYVSNWSYITTPDSPAASLLLIGIYFYWRAYYASENRIVVRSLFYASIFFAWAIVLRPYLSVIVLILALILLLRKRSVYPLLPRIIAFCALPFILMIGPWVIRNYNLTGKIIPFQQDMYAGYGYRPAELQIRKMVNSLGEDGGTFWDPTAMASYFSPETYSTTKFTYPAYLVSDTNLYSRIERLRNAYLDSTIVRTAEQENSLKSEATGIRADYIKKYKLRYYIINPLKRAAKFWGHSGSYYLPSQKQPNILLLGNKVLQSLLYFSALLFGTIGLMLYSRKNDFGWILLIPLIFLTIFFPVVFAFMEPRYAMGFYYPGVIGLLYLFHLLTKRFLPRGKFE
jgi:hypothetical protein